MSDVLCEKQSPACLHYSDVESVAGLRDSLILKKISNKIARNNREAKVKIEIVKLGQK